ncbi:KIF1-binding [Araneus ventricosus]|uniref:KIF-binding protein n=1 Tax=Araneus ventricosus TaxID=182803 RepID=A0A4Y2BL62_ARAVE|nr:KIF1-binding [Araneus ventricosus]
MFVSEYTLWLTSAHERYVAAKKLVEASKNDPPTEPYRSKYRAKDMLTDLVCELEKWRNVSEVQIRLLSILINYEISVLKIETDETGSGSQVLTIILEEARAVAETPECIHLTIKILNQLGIIWSERGEVEKSLAYLQEAETLYNNYKTKNNRCPFELEELFTVENVTNEDWTSFEKTFTHTLYYLAQVYEHLDDSNKSAMYCRETLKRQRESGEYETNDWAMNCATLSQYFIQEKQFPEARHLLSCAAYVLLKYEIKVEQKLEENRDAWTEVHQSKASLSCCWLKYCVNLLAEPPYSEEKDKESEKFSRLIEDEDVIKMEKRIPCYITSYDDAKSLFIFATNHVSVAKSYFTLNEYANNYSQIIQDNSKLYKNLAAHDPDRGRQCKMHKRRLDILEELLRRLNPQFYLAVCRQLQFELGEICHEMIDLKTKIANESGEGLNVHRAKKINSLALKGIQHFQDFIDSMKDKDGNLPTTYSKDIVRPALIAHFYIGRYYSKLIESDTNKKLHNLSKTELYYNYIVKYAEANPQHANNVEHELPVVKEMLELMSEKMNQITCSTLF